MITYGISSILMVIVIVIIAIFVIVFIHSYRKEKNAPKTTIRGNSTLCYIVAMLITLAGLIGGFCCLWIDDYGVALGIGVWVSTFLIVLIYYGIGDILDNQKNILLKLNQNSREQNQYLRKLNQENHNNSTSPVQTNAQTKVSLKDDKQNIANSTKNSDEKELKNGQVKCPHCGAIHTLKNCMRCGKTIFEDEK